MYTQHFHLSEPPFSIAPNPRYLYLSPKHREALAHLLYGIGVGGGFVVLSGEVGMGKTTLCRALLDQLPEDVELALIFNPRLNSRELLAGICDELHIAYQGPRASLKQLIDALNRYLLDAHAAGRRVIVLIDEAQNLRFDVLEQIRLLTNLETDQAKLLQIILVGQPELNQVLDRPNLRQLAQRITARFHLLPLSLRETRDYLEHRLRVAGVIDPVFSSSSVKAIYRASKGIPRLINLLADRSLLGAYALGRHRVDGSIAAKAGRELLGLRVNRARRWPRFLLASFLLLALSLMAIPVMDPKMDTVKPVMAWIQRHHSLITLDGEPPLTVPPSQEAAPTETVNVPPPVTESPSVKAQEDFLGWLSAGGQGRREALISLSRRWDPGLPSTDADPCIEINAAGLRCQSLQIAWQQLLKLNLPAVLELTKPDGGQRFLMLSAVVKGQPVFSVEGVEHSFDVADVLLRWTGRSTVIWKPPAAVTTSSLKPLMSSPLVPWIRQRLGATAGPGQDLVYDEELAQKVKEFQRQLELRADGLIGVLTLMGLAGHSAEVEVPKLTPPAMSERGGP